MANQICKAALTQSLNLGIQFGRVQNVIALLINHLALIVGHIVVLEQLLAHIEVARFYFALGAFNAARDHARFNGFTFRHLEAVHDGPYAIARKNAHEWIV